MLNGFILFDELRGERAASFVVMVRGEREIARYKASSCDLVRGS